MLHGKWWEIYNEPELNALEDQLNINNQNIKEAFENFMEARTLVREARSQLYPTLAWGPSYSRSQHVNESGRDDLRPTMAGRQSQVFACRLRFRGSRTSGARCATTIHRAQYNAQLSEADLDNEKLTEQASLASYFFEIRGQDALQKLLNDT